LWAWAAGPRLRPHQPPPQRVPAGGRCAIEHTRVPHLPSPHAQARRRRPGFPQATPTKPHPPSRTPPKVRASRARASAPKPAHIETDASQHAPSGPAHSQARHLKARASSTRVPSAAHPHRGTSQGAARPRRGTSQGAACPRCGMSQVRHVQKRGAPHITRHPHVGPRAVFAPRHRQPDPSGRIRKRAWPVRVPPASVAPRAGNANGPAAHSSAAGPFATLVAGTGFEPVTFRL
jgi:hypothetical protein